MSIQNFKKPITMANNLHCLFCPVQAEIANHAQHVEYESHAFVLYCVDNVAVMLCVKKSGIQGKEIFKLGKKY